MLCRLVLDDVEQCLQWLEDEPDEFRFRMVLVAAIALVRTVGHVLRNIDSRNDEKLKRVVDDKFEAWRQNREKSKVFWEFINEERNSILKEYEFRFDFAPIVTTAESDHAWRVGSNLYCPVAEGVYAGEDVRDVLKEAVAWWRRELQEIEGLSSQSTDPS